MHFKGLRAAVGILALAALLAGCLGIAGREKLALDADFPDPSATPLPGGAMMMYSTNGAGMHVPSFCLVPDKTTTYKPGCLTDGHPTDALPHPENASWYDAPRNLTWAPSVRKIGNQWVMVVVAPAKNHLAPCIGWATAKSPKGPFSFTAMHICAANNFVGLFDPYLFVAPEDGRVWLYYSRQWSAYGGSEIDAQQLSGDGMRLVGPATIMVKFRDVAALNTGGNGQLAFVENPAVVADSANGRDLLVSVGDWHDPGYNTIEVMCDHSYGGCAPGGGRLLQLSSLPPPRGEAGTGGASLVRDDSPRGNRIVFHGWPCATKPCVNHYGPYQARLPYVAATKSCTPVQLTACRTAAPSARAAPAARLPYQLASPGVLPPGATYQTDQRTPMP